MTDVFNPRWTDLHRDAEMSYVIQSTISGLPSTLSFNKFSHAVADIFTTVMHEREPQSAQMFNAADLARISSKVFRAKGQFEWYNSSFREEVANALVFAWLTYVHSLLLGAPSPRAEVDTYWPFGNEGGFCNPMKLKLLEEG